MIDSYLNEFTEARNLDMDEDEESTAAEKEESRKLLVEKTVTELSGMSLSNEQLAECVHLLITHALSSTSGNQTSEMGQLGKLFSRAPLAAAFLAGLASHTLPTLATLESTYLCVKSNLSVMIATALCDEVMSFGDLSGLLRHGAHYPLFFLCMQHAARMRSPEWLRERIITRSRISLVDMLPPAHQDDERTPKQRLVQCLDDRELTFVCPMLKLESRMFDVIANTSDDDDHHAELNKWIEDNVDVDIRASSDFIISLVTW